MTVTCTAKTVYSTAREETELVEVPHPEGGTQTEEKVTRFPETYLVRFNGVTGPFDLITEDADRYEEGEEYSVILRHKPKGEDE